NRLGYGPAPGDVDRIRQIGIDRYLDEQLHPERLPLPAALQQQLDALGSTHWSQHELITQFREAGKAAKAGSEDGTSMRRDLYQRVTLESGEERLLRAIQSPRQLQEVMVDFWFNHFNVYSGKGMERVLVENYEREAIRPHALGRFRDLLGATAHHPAMLFYLDNWLSTAPGFQPRHGAGPLAKSSGLNENYARELMELHTLGVDGGYTQKDVTELARMLTGWTMNARARAGDSIAAFDPRRHDNGDKEWLGHHVSKHGESEGEWALDVLASHPATAHHITFQLAQYFVADAPPPVLVDRLSRRFLDTGGDIGAVLKTLFDSPEFRDPRWRGTKFKTPYRYVVSSVRASNVPVTHVRPLLATLYQLGMPLYGCPTPDGYKNTEEAWLNPDAVTRRINFATAFASGKLPFARPMSDTDAKGMGAKAMQRAADKGDGARFNPAWATAPIDGEALLNTLGESVSATTRATVAQSDPVLRAALLLGSPDFMHH
ncbi:MAG: DUF1800 domain-containing protein, partial [Burkholderiaceae bacterium]|nr:DUF1800 domain-containing protein [Burkholderiaceae bacterium]